MKIEQLTINPDNHHLFDIGFNDDDSTMRLFRLTKGIPNERDVGGKSYTFEDILALNLEINGYFDSELGAESDWGGRYAKWLGSNGFDANSDNGWWSKSAVTPRLIKSFVSEMKDKG